MDKAGRVVIPKAIRDGWSMPEGGDLQCREDENGNLVIGPEPVEWTLQKDEYGFTVAVPSRPVPPLTAEDVRNVIEEIREERHRRNMGMASE